MSKIDETQEVLNSQDEEQVIEVDADGNVKQPGEAAVKRGGKPTILRDPKGEY